jgi:hypothetical protein
MWANKNKVLSFLIATVIIGASAIWSSKTRDLVANRQAAT